MTTITATSVLSSKHAVTGDQMDVRSCPHCKNLKDVSAFQLQRGGKPGGWCRECRTALEQQRRRARGIGPRKTSTIIEGKKLCLQCEKMLPLTEFSRTSRGLGGVAAYCKKCFSLRYEVPREEACKRTQKYRRANKARWRALHRLHQFNRRSNIAATSDWTVTTEFMESIYATERCFYCDGVTPEHLRTADHLTPLSRGGDHSAANMRMACLSCNSAKSNKTEDEYRSYVNDDNNR